MDQSVLILTENSFPNQTSLSTQALREMVTRKLFPENAPFKRFAFVYEENDTHAVVQKLVALMHNLGFQNSKTWKYINAKHNIILEAKRMKSEHFNIIVVASREALLQQNVEKELQNNNLNVELVQF